MKHLRGTRDPLRVIGREMYASFANVPGIAPFPLRRLLHDRLRNLLDLVSYRHWCPNGACH